MNVKVLSLIIPVLIVAGTASAAEIFNKDGNKLDLYSKVDGQYSFSKNEDQDGNQSYARLGIKGETQINSLLTGYGQWEYQIATNQPESSKSNNAITRLGFAGLKIDEVGNLDFGRNYGVVYDITSWTDVLPAFGGDAYGADNFLQSRANSLLTYRNTDFFGLINGLKFALQYQAKNGSAFGSNPLTQNGEGFGGSMTYDIGHGFSVGSALSSSRRTRAQNTLIYGPARDAKTYSAGIKYNNSGLYLAAQYTQTYNATRFGKVDTENIAGFADKAQNLELVAQYEFDFGLRPSLAYLQSKGKRIENGYGDQFLVKYIDIGTTYAFNKNMSTYVDYKINLLNDNQFTRKAGINTDNVIAIGVIYQF